ncbi:TnpV protein [Bifidobacterium longum]|uniref:TnpV protein n=1 Tax=Bifidobacterium longum TaxID=216816 RepID=UPI0019D19AB7
MRDCYAENPYEKTPLDYSWAYVRQYCAEIDEAARNRMELIVRSLAEQNGVTEQLKAENQMEWVRQMNACKAQAEEIVKAELIYD